MKREEAKQLLPIIQAFAEGRPIQYRMKDIKSAKWNDIYKNYHEFSPHSFQYRIKSEQEPKYRPFKDAEECWQEMLKHQPFGWIKGKEDEYHTFITTVDNNDEMSLSGNSGWSFLGIMNNYTFADGTPFGIKEEE